MCLIIASKPNHRSSEFYLKTAAEMNGDGIGVAYNLNNELVVKKDFASFDHFYAYYQNIPLESNVLVHFRLASVGSKSAANIHPFTIDSEDESNTNLVFCHNGTLDFYKLDAEKSDSMLFGVMTLRPFYQMDNEFYKKPFVQRLLLDHIKTSRLVIFNNLGEFTIFNKAAGFEEDEIWYSNKLFKDKIEREEKKEKAKNKHKAARPVIYNPSQYFLPDSVVNPNKGADSKKKYYLCGDQSYTPLSDSDIEELKRIHRANGIKRLKKKGIIDRLNKVPYATICKALLDKQDADRAKSSSSEGKQLLLLPPNSDVKNPVMNVNNIFGWREKWGKLTKKQQEYLIMFQMTHVILEPDFTFPEDLFLEEKIITGREINQNIIDVDDMEKSEKELDEIGRIIQEE